MKNKDIYSKIRDKIVDQEVDVPAGCWSAINRRIAFSRRAAARRVAWYAVAAAIAALTVFVVLTDKTDESIVYTAEVAQEVQNDNTSIAGNITEPKQPESGNNIKEIACNNHNALNKIHSVSKNTYNTGSYNVTAKEEVEYKDVADISEPEGVNSSVQDSAHTTKSDAVKYREYINDLKESSPITSIEASEYDHYKYDNGISMSLVSANTLSANADNENWRRNSSPLSDELHLYSAPEPLQFKHKMPISVGMTVEKRWKNNWGIESGLVYTLLRSTYTTESRSQEGEQELHYIGIPVQVTYRFAQLKRFGFYAAAGPKIDFNVAGKRTETLQNSIATNNSSEKIRDKRPQFSVLLRAGVGFSIVKHLELYAEPSLAYYIDNKGDIPDLWKDRPFNFVLQLGLRSNF